MIIELLPITLQEYLKLNNFTKDYNIVDDTKEYLIELYSNGNKRTNFKLIHKLLFFDDLLLEYLNYLKSINIDIHNFLLENSKDIHLIHLCVNCKLTISLKILLQYTEYVENNTWFITGLYNKLYIINDNNKQFISLKNIEAELTQNGFLKTSQRLEENPDEFLKNIKYKENNRYFKYNESQIKQFELNNEINNIIISNMYKYYKFIDVNDIQDIYLLKILCMIYKNNEQ
jgi:hypothetical protein